MFCIRQLLLGLGLLLSVFSVAGIALAETNGDSSVATILSIDVQGNRFVEKEMVLSKIKTKKGQNLSRKQLSRDVRTLHKTGFFSDVSFSGTRTANGIHLICHVKEYPLIAKLEIEGNEEHEAKDLQLRMKLRPGRIFSPTNKESDLNTLRKGYLKDGYYQVDVSFVSTPRDDGRVDVLVKIHEGEVTHVQRIRFVGNQVFSDSRLRSEISSRESSFSSWLSDSDVFDQKRFGADAQMLQRFYMNNGYLDFRIESSQVNMTADKKSFNFAFNVHEGKQYTTSSVDVQGDLLPDKETLLDLVQVEAGDTYSHTDMMETIAALTDRIGDEGYANASVTPLMTRKLSESTVAIIFDIEKGAEVYVERIEISGNAKSEDAVIRRLLKQHEGARYSGSQVKQSKEGVQRSGLLEDARVSFPKGSSTGKVIMKVDVEEKRTGSISGGVGYSQQEKMILTAKLSEQNLFGKGYQGSLNGTYGKITQDITASLADPYFYADNVSATINGFTRTVDPLSTQNYQTTGFGGGVGFGVPILNHLSYGINYQYTQTELSVVNQALVTSLLIQAQQGKQTTGLVSQRLTWDNRDRIMAPTEGHMEQLGFGVAGLGGNDKFYEASFESHAYFSFGDENRVTLNPNFTAGMISGYSNAKVPLQRRYSLGGMGSVRGFDSFGISLRDPVTNDPVGGDKKFTASLNLFVPMPLIATAGLRGVFFVDAGTVWGAASATVGATTVSVNEPFSLSRVRSSAGFGIEWQSPVGPIGMVWGFPLRKVAGDSVKSFEFVLGGSF